MASPRARIDQFFSSKKKKRAISPGTKSGLSEKEGNSSKDASPSAKGSLDCYLVSSQNENRLFKQAPAKRNLKLETGLSKNIEKRESLLNNVGQSLNSSQSGSVPGEATVFEEATDLGIRGDANETCALAVTVDHQNLELKQFATNFLSTYCSNISSHVQLESKCNEHKRHGSPSMLAAEDKASKKRHCTSYADQLQSSNEVPVCTGKGSDVSSPGIAAEKPEIVLQSHIEVEGGDFSERQSSLIRCTKTRISPSLKHECSTPGTIHIKSRARETPKSARGSSVFSPGEAFWNEAIQVADGLFGVDIDREKLRTEKNSNNFRNENFDCKSECASGVEKICDQHNNAETHGSLGFPGKQVHGDGSPLPIKHFDFLLDDKNLVENTPKQLCFDDKGVVSIKNGSVQLECSSANNKALQGRSNIWAGKIDGGPAVAETFSAQIAHKQNLDFQIPVSDSFLSHLPHLEKEKVIAGVVSNGLSTPSSIPVKDHLDLSNWVPPEVCHVYRKKGLSKLYPWQVDCLQVDGVLQRRNLVYCASTSAGKSFVAEILMLRMVIMTGKMAILVLPYVSICAEKAEHLEVLLEPLGKHVRSFYGSQGGATLPKDTSVAVCTIEKANSLFNRLLEEDRLSEVGIVVIDELHMVADPHRGYLLELLLTKLRYAAGEGNVQSSSGESSGTSSSKSDSTHGLQIVGMSATMPNVAAVAEWLHAALYQTEFRPVPLEEYIKVGSIIYNKNMEIVKTMSKAADLGGKDPDHIVELCNEIVQEGNSVLLFCSSRKGCESTARHVSKYLKKFAAKVQDDQSEFVDASAAIDALRRSPVGLDPTLEETLPFGVAYHHAGLTVEEREVVETCYRKGIIRVLTATSTLAAGVNLPARRVIFRQPKIGRDFIDGTRYRQMAGRAGRTGIDEKGESVLICRPEEVKRVKSLLNDSCPPLQSCLSEDKNGMTHAIMEVVASGIVQTANDIHRYVRCTLLNSTKPFQDVVKSAQDSLKWLCHRKFLEWNEETKLYSATPLGRAAFGSSLSPEESLIVMENLSRAREGFILASDLHIVYLVTPINVEVEPDWKLFYERFMELSAIDQTVGSRVGVLEPFLMRMAHGAPLRPANRSRDDPKGLHCRIDSNIFTNNNMLSDEKSLRVCKRFYIALILSQLVQEVPVSEVCDAFKVARGMVQSLQENAGRFASMVSSFCERIGWHDLEVLVAKFQNRVSFGVRAEIVELTTIPYVKGSRARALYKAGLRTPQAIAEVSVKEIAKAIFESSWAVQENVAQRNMQFGIAKKIKNGARKIVLDKAEEARVAAFSAFRSLGLNVPQFSGLVLANSASNPTKQAVSTSSDDGNTSSSVGLQIQVKNNPAGNSEERTERFCEVASETDVAKSKKVSDLQINACTETNLDIALPQNTAGRSSVLDEKLIPSSVNDFKLMVDQTLNISSSAVIEENTANTERQRLESRETAYTEHNDSSIEKGPASVSCALGGLDSFLDLWDSVAEFYFDIHFNKKPEANSEVLFEVHGIAICWESSPVFYINLHKDLFCSRQSSLEVANLRWNRINRIMGKSNVRKVTWNLKAQLHALKNAVVSLNRFKSGTPPNENKVIQLSDGFYYKLSPISVADAIDMCIIAWILWPDEERNSNPNLEKEVKKRLSSEALAAANRSGRWKNQMRRAAHNGCCRRVAHTRALSSALWKILVSEELDQVLMNIEIPLVNVLADMEACGIGVDMEGCLQARHVLSKKLRILEKEAYTLAGMTFSLYTPADIANVLYERLKLPIPEGHNKGKQHASTDKHCLDLLKNDHPIVPVIKEHRTLSKLFHSTLGSMCKLARLCMPTQRYTLHGHWLQTSTATGRLSMEEPNLQCVEHMIEFKMCQENEVQSDSDPENYNVNARDFFIPTKENWLLITADYSQIELRLMAHFSRDSSLIELLSNPNGDVFTLIASKWMGKPETAITTQERDQTKRLVYGILYGMGANSLAEQLNCSSDEAKGKIKSFKASFPGVASWVQEAVAFCRQKGYVQTLKGRKRFLSKIKLGNDKEKSKAERQAVNSVCQGSAADIIKIAMLNIYSVIAGVETPTSNNSLYEKFHMLKGNCRILLQVHDELVLEADPSMVKEAGSLLRTCMENAAFLSVPLLVKLKIGKTWGSLEPFNVEELKHNHTLIS